MRKGLRAGILVLVATLLGLAQAPPTHAGAAPTWLLPPQSVSEPAQSTNHLDLATGSDGTVIAAWREFDGENLSVRAAVRPPDGTFGVPLSLSTSGTDADDPRVAVGPDGFAVIVWKADSGSGDVIQARVRHPNGQFGPVEDLSEDGHDATDPALAIASDGTSIVTWTRLDGSDWVIEARVKRPGEAFDPTETLSLPGGSAYRPDVAVSPEGTFHLVWFRFDGSVNVAQAVSRPPEGDFSEPADLSAPGLDAIDPTIAAGPDDAAIVAWQQTDFEGSSIAVSRRGTSGSFGPPEVISAPDQASNPVAAFDDDGNYAVAWLSAGIDEDQLGLRFGSGESLAAAQTISSAGDDAGKPDMAFSADGDLTFAWARKLGGQATIEARTRRGTDGSLSEVTELTDGSALSLGPRVVATPDGVMTAAWVTYGNFVGSVESASTAPPQVDLTVEKDPGGLGKVTSDPAGIDCGDICNAGFDLGESVRLTTKPAENNTFVEWKGACEGSTSVCEVTMDSARTVRAVFAPRFEVLVQRSGSGQGAVSSTPAGIDCGDSCVASFERGETVTLVAAPAAGSRFSGWTGDCLGIELTCEVEVTQARLVTAQFDRFCEKRSLSLSKMQSDRRRGHVTFKFIAAEAGTMRLRPTRLTRGATLKVGKNGQGKVTVRPSAKGRRMLKRKGRIQVRVKLTFVPSISACRPIGRSEKLWLSVRR